MRRMYTDFVKWMKWVGFFLILMAFPAFLIILSTKHGEMVPGLISGIEQYFLVFNKKIVQCGSGRDEEV